MGFNSGLKELTMVRQILVRFSQWNIFKYLMIRYLGNACKTGARGGAVG